MAECEICHAWQHGTCMGYQSPETMPLHYYCEQCRPDLYTELLKCASFSFPCENAVSRCLNSPESTPNAPGSRRRHRTTPRRTRRARPARTRPRTS